MPAIDDEGADHRPFLAAFAEPWPGAVALYRGGGETTPVLAGAAPARATMGRLETALPPGFAGRWDLRDVRLRLAFGALSARSEDEVLGGANLLAVETALGWELLQFQDAEIETDGAWRLATMLRGQAGSEAQAAIGAPASARAVFVNSALARAVFPLSLRGLSQQWQAGPDGEVPDTAVYSSKDVTIEAQALKPLSPVHLRATRQGGDVLITWIRRTRIGGDSWEGEVPLGEVFERYQLTVFSNNMPVRNIETDKREFAYAAGDIAADFSGAFDPASPGAALDIGVAQVSDRVGAGAMARRLVYIR